MTPGGVAWPLIQAPRREDAKRTLSVTSGLRADGRWGVASPDEQCRPASPRGAHGAGTPDEAALPCGPLPYDARPGGPRSRGLGVSEEPPDDAPAG